MRRPFSLSSPSSGWTSDGIAVRALLRALVRVFVLLFRVELEEDAAGVLRVDVRLRPAVAALDAMERLYPVVAHGLRRFVDVLDLEGDVMEAGPALGEESVEVAVFAKRLQQLEVGGAAGHLQGDAPKAGLFVLPAARFAHSHELREERQGIVQLSHRPADVVQPLYRDLLVHTVRQPPATLRSKRGPIMIAADPLVVTTAPRIVFRHGQRRPQGDAHHREPGCAQRSLAEAAGRGGALAAVPGLAGGVAAHGRAAASDGAGGGGGGARAAAAVRLRRRRHAERGGERP